MNNDPSALGTYLKGPVRLRFADGEVVEATRWAREYVVSESRSVPTSLTSACSVESAL